jgi:hypothetical protein
MWDATVPGVIVNLRVRLRLPSPVAATKSLRLQHLPFGVLLSLTGSPVTLFLEVCTPPPLDPIYVNIMPIFANTP